MINMIIDQIKSEVIYSADYANNIVFGVDGSFASHSLITILSIVKNNNGSTFNFHIISSNIDRGIKDKYKKIISGSPHGLSIHHVNGELFSNYRTTELFSKATYYRFLAPLLLRSADTLLYLDADIVCLSPFNDLWLEIKKTKNIALVVSESSVLKGELSKSAGLRGDDYFNAGMMLIDVKKWNDNRVSETAIRILEENSQHLNYLDQDALNIVLEDNVSFIDKKFNTIFKLNHDTESYKTDIPVDTIFLHYAGADKPWQKWNEQLACRHYRDIYSISPISEHPFDSPHNCQQAKKMYKLQAKKKNPLACIYWRFKYYQLRYL